MALTDRVTTEYAESVCAIGQGHKTCRYLTMGGDGWSCVKNTELKHEVDRRVAAGLFTARSDNCDGRAA